ncbi:hypothetical protein [Maritalea sp.]|uniref:hypothetical protein n=1 Tax=Maritalea sp. TaxID=2003361 RepID=UPI003EFA5B86
MYCSIGKQLGSLLAHYEQDLDRNPDDIEALKKISLLSHAYRNFAQGDLKEFVQDFDAEYAEVTVSLNGTAKASPAEERRAWLDAVGEVPPQQEP